jgi:AraC family ethanolamine operon transcriptional activator
MTHTIVYPEFEAYAASLHGVETRVLLAKRITPSWEMSSFAIGNIHLQFGFEGSGTIAEGAVAAGGRMFFVPLAGRYRGNGLLMNNGTLLAADAGREFSIAVLEAHDWCSVHLPYEVLRPTAEDAEPVSAMKPGSMLLNPGDPIMHRIRYLVRSLFASIRVEPTLLSAPLAISTIHAELLAAFQSLVDRKHVSAPTLGRRRLSRHELLRLIWNLLDQCPEHWLSVEEFAQTADVSVRTIRNVFLERYGVSPLRFMLLHRLHQVRRELQSAEATFTTVTEVAARYGFWHFGRFANHYRRLFGELPSQSLRRLPYDRGGTGRNRR